MQLTGVCQLETGLKGGGEEGGGLLAGNEITQSSQ